MSNSDSATRNINALLSRGGDLLREGKVEGARSCFEDALDIDSAHEKTLGLLGLTLFRLSDFKVALGVYEKLVAQSSENASYRLNLGLVHLKLDRANDAIAELARSRELDPSQLRTVSYLGLAYARSGQYENAYEAFLCSEQESLATEMEQYIDEKTRRHLRAKVGGGSPQPSDADESYAETQIAEASEHNDFDFQALPDVEPSYQPGGEPDSLFRGGMVTRAVDAVEPAMPGGSAGAGSGKSTSESLAAFAAKRLLRPPDDLQSLEVGAGGVLIAQVRKRLISRTEGILLSSGVLEFKVATRRIRGRQSDEEFGEKDAKLFLVSGEGYLMVSPGSACFTALTLDNDVLYLREPTVFAFDPYLGWENGRIPGSELRVVQFRGSGSVAMRTPRKVLSVSLTAERVLNVDAEALAGWIGRVVPKLTNPAARGGILSPFVECSGEGTVLLHDLQRSA